MPTPAARSECCTALDLTGRGEVHRTKYCFVDHEARFSCHIEHIGEYPAVGEDLQPGGRVRAERGLIVDCGYGILFADCVALGRVGALDRAGS